MRGAVGQDDRELLAAHAGHQVHGPNGLCDGARHGTDDVVAGAMAVGVVDGLEVVDVQHQQQGGLAGAGDAVDLAGQGHLEAAAVDEAGQRVLAGQVAQRVQHALQPGGAVGHRIRKQCTGLLQQLQGLVQNERFGVDQVRGGQAVFQRSWAGGTDRRIVVSSQSSSGLRAARS